MRFLVQSVMFIATRNVVGIGFVKGQEFSGISNFKFGASSNDRNHIDQPFVPLQEIYRSPPPFRPWPPAQFRQATQPAINWHDVIERLLEVRCISERMSIVLHYDKNYSRLPMTLVEVLRRARLYAETSGADSTACTSVSQSIGTGEDGVLILTTDYDDCGVEMGRHSNDVIAYSIMVIVEANYSISGARSADQIDDYGDNQQENVIREIKEGYRIRCLHPVKSKTDEENMSFSLLLSDEKYAKSYWTYPRSVDLGARIFLHSNVSLSWYNEPGLYGLPLNCWTSPHQFFLNSSSSASPRKAFLKDGCQVNDNRQRGLSQVHHFKDAPTKVSIHLGQYLLFSVADKHDEPLGPPSPAAASPTWRYKNVAMLNCEVIPCVQSFTLGLLNIPKCPISYYCAGIPQLSHALPVQLRNVKRTTVSAGPLTVLSKEEKSAAVTQPNRNCELACAQQALQMEKTNLIKYADEGIIKTQFVIIVAFISFCFGLLVMGALWWVHVRTDPSRSKTDSTISSVSRTIPATSPKMAPVSHGNQVKSLRLKSN